MQFWTVVSLVQSVETFPVLLTVHKLCVLLGVMIYLTTPVEVNYKIHCPVIIIISISWHYQHRPEILWMHVRTHDPTRPHRRFIEVISPVDAHHRHIWLIVRQSTTNHIISVVVRIMIARTCPSYTYVSSLITDKHLKDTQAGIAASQYFLFVWQIYNIHVFNVCSC